MATIAAHHEESWVRRYLFSTDHKVIGKQYLFTGLFMALVGGLFAAAFRTNLAAPGVLTDKAYLTLVTYHGSIMFFWVAMPILLGAYGNLLIPLMIGARDMAFPTLNMLSYWTFLLSAIILIVSLLVPGGGFGGGWTMYPPLSADPAAFLGEHLGTILFILAVAVEFAAMLMGGVNFIATILTMRTKGMTLFRMPIMIWMQLIASILFLLSVTPLIAGALMLLMDITLGTHFFRVTAEHVGNPVLFQHLFWFFGHPEVYVILFPAIGIIAEIFPANARRPFYSYKILIWAGIIAGILSFLVWAHHQFVAGINPYSAIWFSVFTIAISVPFSVMLVTMGLSLVNGSIRLTAPMLWALGAYAMFIIGGLSGLPLGAFTADIYLHDTYFVVAHFHYTVFTIVVLSGIAGIYHWFPKWFGRKLNEKFGRWHAILTLIFYNGFAFPGFFLGMAGHPRRYASLGFLDYLHQYQWVHVLMTVSTYLLFATQIVFAIYFIYAVFKGEKIKERNPWKATTLEWLAPTPPPHLNWGNTQPVVERDPYEYAVNGELKEKGIDFLPQGRLYILKNVPEHEA